MDRQLDIKALDLTELDKIALIHRAAFPKSALTALGLKAVAKYYEWLLTGPHDALTIGAYHNGKLIGFLFGGTFRGALSGFLRQNRMFLFWRVLSHPYLIGNPIFRERLEFAIRILLRKWPQKSAPTRIERKREPSFGILAIAVDPQSQGYGAGRILMENAETVARSRNCKRMNLSVDVDNTQAIGFYEHLGWKKSSPDKWNGYMFKDLE